MKEKIIIARSLHIILVDCRISSATHNDNDPESVRMMEIYQTLDDGRIVELNIGQASDNGEAVWARNLSSVEKAAYLNLKRLGYSDIDIYNNLNQEIGLTESAGR